MTDYKSTTFFFWCCLAQSLIIIGLAFYAGNEKADKEELVKEKEMASFGLMVTEGEVSRLKVLLDSCRHGEKK
ncbi:MAG: hypothetical protein JWM14_666 [Chitinophagaceae bacterium]|nr:hypothetical protein [Chitinophagaceae bacterium]